jgi:HlyD family secretion protein
MWEFAGPDERGAALPAEEQPREPDTGATSRRKVWIGVGLAVMIGAAAVLALVRSGDRGVQVGMDEVTLQDLVSTVTASGNIRPRRTVDISSDVSARVAVIEVQEGDDVEQGDVLVRLDPTRFEALLRRARAALSQAEAQAAQTEANLLQASRSHERLVALFVRDSLLVSPQQLDDAETQLDVARANMDAAEFGVRQAEASVEEAADDLEKTVIRAPMSGKVTRLNIEEGETVIIGTMNNPGSLILTISDLAVVEAVVQVDETDLPELSLGDSASVEIDAFPGVPFAGRVTEIGNSAVEPPSGQSGQTAAVDFEVVITLVDPPVVLRPDLSATAEIVTEMKKDVPAVPIIAVTVRDRGPSEGSTDSEAEETDSDDPRDVEGVFVVRDGIVTFTPVDVGIAGQEHFEVRSGVEVGDAVVSGPYQVIRELQDGDRVRRRNEPGEP